MDEWVLHYIPVGVDAWVMAEWWARWSPLWVAEVVSEIQRSWMGNHTSGHKAIRIDIFPAASASFYVFSIKDVISVNPAATWRDDNVIIM